MGCSGSKAKPVNKAEQVSKEKTDQAILDLKITRDRLKKYQKQQEHCSELELQKAKELLKNKQTDRARIVLKQKKAREVYINNAEKMLQNIEQQIYNIENKQMEMEVFDNLKATNDILKHMNDLMPVEEVERIMDENAEQNDRLEEIGDLLAQNMSKEDTQAVEDDLDALLAEFEAENGGAEAESESSSSVEEAAPVKAKPQKVAMPA
ncbi:Charged multivesicular body protein 6 [Tritrichomonas foetus]|uniref:Charged multivesicular body protein 6 n=1 Tax=Tritrichomonas foetus TaxID=1144522 RepID=A0A1J4KI98_9EUKA|nr:Charged multivesicular body protein 6 [Tritrichomonas foetus]|eukprot:OHT11095.1 Charged multivesicular body protein 6 [Tritrichomonas foetus]